ncbi:hypothetical protein [Herbiconiux liukaitaii]|uniref:hypothetical protein n=1 Tax=Herbiconiux liukaitaii TaxID=3342799 RepID=UPI0035B9B365
MTAGATVLAGCASATSSPGESHVAVASAEPSPTPSVGPRPPFDPGEHGTGDPERDMSLISAEFVAGLEAVREFGPRVHPDVYTGVGGGIPGDPDVLRILITDRDPAIEAEFLAASGLPAEKVAFFTSVRSERDALALQNRIMADFQSGAISSAEVPEVATFGPDEDGLVVIGMTGHDPAQIDLLWQRYGPYVRFWTDEHVSIDFGASVAGS